MQDIPDVQIGCGHVYRCIRPIDLALTAMNKSEGEPARLERNDQLVLVEAFGNFKLIVITPGPKFGRSLYLGWPNQASLATTLVPDGLYQFRLAIDQNRTDFGSGVDITPRCTCWSCIKGRLGPEDEAVPCQSCNAGRAYAMVQKLLTTPPPDATALGANRSASYPYQFDDQREKLPSRLVRGTTLPSGS